MRVIGVVENRKANNARIRIISFRRKNAYITDLNELQEVFPPDGYVFAPVLPEKFQVNDLIDFQTIVAPYSSKPNDDAFFLDKNSGCNFAGYEVITTPYSVLIEGRSIDIDQIDAVMIRPNSEFYLLINDFLYGPLKKYDDYIQPVKELYQIAVGDTTMYPAGDRLYLLSKPAGVVKCDSMSQEQLSDWFKDQVRNLGSLIDLQSVRQAIQNHNLIALDGVRMNRAIKTLDQLLLNQAELKIIAEGLPNFGVLYESALSQVYEEIASPVRRKVIELEQEVADLKLAKEHAAYAVAEEVNLLADATAQLRNIQSEKSRLIEDIKIHALVNQSAASATTTTGLIKFEVQDFVAVRDAWENIAEFIKAFKQTFIAGREDLVKTAYALLLLLKDYKCLLTVTPEPVIQIARLTNNAKVIIQQVEPDWLKFDSLYHNGLKYAWESAQVSPEIIHFFILQDINLASPECYAKPLNDILAGLRKSLPGLLGSYPNNLWIFGSPISPGLEQDFGLPLLKSTFKHWGAVPVKDGEWEFNTENPGFRLSLSMLTDHDEIAVSSPDDYFSKV